MSQEQRDGRRDFARLSTGSAIIRIDPQASRSFIESLKMQTSIQKIRERFSTISSDESIKLSEEYVNKLSYILSEALSLFTDNNLGVIVSSRFGKQIVISRISSFASAMISRVSSIVSEVSSQVLDTLAVASDSEKIRLVKTYENAVDTFYTIFDVVIEFGNRIITIGHLNLPSEMR
ncbi:MAG: hypothetical protein QXN08_08790, partial [Nitrososphaerales archaeon]